MLKDTHLSIRKYPHERNILITMRYNLASCFYYARQDIFVQKLINLIKNFQLLPK